MKHLNTALHIISLAAIAILFFLVLKNQNPGNKVHAANSKTDTATTRPGLIAYFEMDSLERHYDYIKDVREQLKSKEQAINNELNSAKKSYMNRIQVLQSKAATMSQQEGEAAQGEINQMQQDLQQKEGRLAQDLQEQQFKLMQNINKKIEDFLMRYNQNKKYSFIISHSPGDFMYFKETNRDITDDLIKGLNEEYKAESTKK